jgi:amidase
MTDLTGLSATAIAHGVARRAFTPTAVLEAHLEAIAAHNKAVNAICTLAADQAREAAAALERDLARGVPAPPLAGVPVGIKDTTDTAGIRTTYGCPLYAEHVPEEDALVVQRLKQAGAIVIGKTNVPEFAAGANTYNPVFGATRNPWNLALSASGSTGGGAAALSARMIALADGSDLGGSLRTPASFCGVVGLRPTPGLVPKWPSAQPFDQLSVQGPMARSVADLALMLQAIAGPARETPLTQPIAGRDFVTASQMRDLAGLRVAYCSDVAGIGVEGPVDAACRHAALALREHGAIVEEVTLDLSAGRKAFLQLRGQLMVTAHLDRLDKLDKLGPNLAGNIRAGLAQSPRDVALGERGREQVRATLRDLFQRFDALALPTAAVLPFPVEQNYPETINGQRMGSYIDWVAPTFCITLGAGPAISVPCGLANGLPVGLQITAPSGAEERVLALAAAVESAQPLPLPSVLERAAVPA